MVINKICRWIRDLIFTVICVNFIEVKGFEGSVDLKVFTSGYYNEYYDVKWSSYLLVWSASHLNFQISIHYTVKNK